MERIYIEHCPQKLQVYILFKHKIFMIVPKTSLNKFQKIDIMQNTYLTTIKLS